jgi:hypothetical protein
MADGTSLVLVTGGGDGTQRRDLVHVDDVVAPSSLPGGPLWPARSSRDRASH